MIADRPSVTNVTDHTRSHISFLNYISTVNLNLAASEGQVPKTLCKRLGAKEQASRGDGLRVIADLHMHSRYSRATSENMNLEELQYYGAIKGLDIIGTGDFTHDKWLEGLKNRLTEVDDSGLFALRSADDRTRFVLSCEVSTIFTYNNQSRHIHHVILTPRLEYAEDLSEKLSGYGDLSVDGRPTLEMSAAELVEIVVETSQENFIFPSHIWTPWFSILGANNGFDSIEECYQDQVSHVSALETGLSSDPPMNWRVESLDRFALLSNSDSHSAWPWRIGREANVFDLKRISYRDIIDAIRSKDPARFLFTIETHPQYGKYHWTGHRKCNVSMPPAEALKLENRCPRCGRKMVKGVEQRVEELATRREGENPTDALGFMHVLPLSEIIATALRLESPALKKVWSIYNLLVGRFGSEVSVLLDASISDLRSTAGDAIANVVTLMRQDRLHVIPGYDGVYGRLVLEDDSPHESDAPGPDKPGLWRYL